MFKKTYTLPFFQAIFSYSKKEGHQDTVLAMAGGRRPESQWLQNLVAQYAQAPRYAADKGAQYFLENNIVPNYVFGDADSAGKDIFNQAQSLGAQVFTYPSEKDDTDLQIVLKQLPTADIIISGVWGGRFDHLYSNIFSLTASMQEHLGTIIMADAKEIMLFLRAEETVNVVFKQAAKIEAISLLPLTGTTKVSLEGVHWPLQEQELSMYHPYAISNVLGQGQQIVCRCQSGYVGVYFSFS